MDRQGLLALYDYNASANAQVLDAAACLPDGDLDRPDSPSHGSVRGVLRHMMACEAGFVSICRGRPPAALPDLATLAAMRPYWEDVARDTLRFIETLDAGDLARELPLELRGGSLRFPVWQLLVQAFVHSAHHRGELSILMTALGRPLPTLDIILHFARQSGQQWPG